MSSQLYVARAIESTLPPHLWGEMSQNLCSLAVVGLDRDRFRISLVIHDKVQKYNGFTERLKGLWVWKLLLDIRLVDSIDNISIQ